MNWTVIVPFKTEGDAKTRLRDRLSDAKRRELADAMLVRLAHALSKSGKAHRMIMVSSKPHPSWPGEWILDRGRGLNGALMEAYSKVERPVAVIHADLPLVEAGDIAAFLDAAEHKGLALAPDRHGTGTNAVALADGRPFTFRFGAHSMKLHRAEAGDRPFATVDRPGLAIDCDTPADLDLVASCRQRDR